MQWLIQAGDNPAYAQAGYDDSHWMLFDPNTSLRRIFSNSRPDVVWYRLHVKVDPNEKGLALSEWNLSSAFDIYVNGQKLLSAGQVAPYKASTFGGRILERIPDAAIASGQLLIAMRVHVSGSDWVSAYPGFYPSNLTIGEQDAVNNRNWLIVIGQNALNWFSQLSGLGLGLIAISLFASQRGQREYLWIFLLFLFNSLAVPLHFYLLFHNLPPWSMFVERGFEIATIIFSTRMFFAFLRIRFGWWIQAIIGLAAAGLLFNAAVDSSGNGTPVLMFVGLLPDLCLLAGVIPVLLIVYFRRGNREAGILLIPAIVSSLTYYLNLSVFLLSQVPGLEKADLWLQETFLFHTIGPFIVDLTSVQSCLFILSLAIILVLRSTRISRQQALLESELAAAREVQQIILPEQIETIPGFQIESAYQPAAEVGGDFFQVLPAPDGALLLVMGDVAGKGMPAAMLVSVLVGATRAVTEYTSDPAEILANLNQRLIGRVSGGFSTALAALISANGLATIANAGHLPPYLDGREVEIPGALPLGIEPDARYKAVQLQLPRGSRLTFYSDGIVEAQNSQGELFGFDRGRQFSMQPVAAIVEAAKQFGQQDDMTVVAITRDMAVATAA